MNLRVLGKLPIFSEAIGRYRWPFYFFRLLNGYSPFPLPLNVGLMLTMRCNLRCDMCLNMQKDSASILSVYREPELSPAEWKDIIQGAGGRFFGPNLHVRGGEPSLYEGYLDVMASIKQQGMRCSYTTNGSFLARDAADIVSIGVDFIQVSLDGPRAVHDSIRGQGVFDRAVRGIRAINETRKARGQETPRILLNCVISGDNAAHFAQLIDIAVELEVNHVVFLYCYFSDAELDLFRVDADLVREEMIRARRMAAGNGISLDFYPPVLLDQIAAYYLQPNNPLGKGCVSPWIRIMIMPNGKVIACRDHTVGDLRIEGATVRKMWNGDKFRAFRRELVKNRLLPDCGRCCRKQY
jgi:MoaA/NifB/PqqE/SkfB family radical SAM enzyme